MESVSEQLSCFQFLHDYKQGYNYHRSTYLWIFTDDYSTGTSRNLHQMMAVFSILVKIARLSHKRDVLI